MKGIISWLTRDFHTTRAGQFEAVSDRSATTRSEHETKNARKPTTHHASKSHYARMRIFGAEPLSIDSGPLCERAIELNRSSQWA